jgi:site-specific DNA-methyltransferase (adenine-specific)
MMMTEEEVIAADDRPAWSEVVSTDQVLLLNGKCEQVMALMLPNSIDAMVCDPPYGLEFMGKDWDSMGDGLRQQRWHQAWANEAFRVLKPGGHLLAFGGTRTFHRLACAIEDAGFEIRDCLSWMYGQGFPKSMDVSKAIDKMGTTDAQQWDGWGTALKPAWEPIIMARKPLIGTVAKNVLTHGTGALNIDGTRIDAGGEKVGPGSWSDPTKRQGVVGTDFGITRSDISKFQEAQALSVERANAMGRWPANVLFAHHEDCRSTGTTIISGDARSGHQEEFGRRESGFFDPGSEAGEGLPNARVHGDQVVETFECHPHCPVGILDRQAGIRTSGKPTVRRTSGADRNGNQGPAYGAESRKDGDPMMGYGDTGTASRFFYQAKVAKSERNRGLPAGMVNDHPTVKPIEVMRWLIRLVTPPGGIVLDPFCGSGTTGIAALDEGFGFVGIDERADYLGIAAHRIGS